MLSHDYGRREDGWPYDDISKNNFFHKMSMSWSLKKGYLAPAGGQNII